MTINYVGSRQFKNRLAEFSYEDNEFERFMKIAAYMKELGWNIDTGVYNWAAIAVADRGEYEDVLADYKEAKRLIKK